MVFLHYLLKKVLYFLEENLICGLKRKIPPTRNIIHFLSRYFLFYGKRLHITFRIFSS